MHYRHLIGGKTPNGYEIETRSLHRREMFHSTRSHFGIGVRDNRLLGLKARRISDSPRSEQSQQALSAQIARSAIRREPSDNREEPRRKGPAHVESISLPVDHRERVLHYVLGIVGVAEKLCSEQRCRTNVAPYQHGEWDVVATRRVGK